MLHIKTILHPTDFSDYSKYAFHLACRLAADYGARLCVLHVKPSPAIVYAEFGVSHSSTRNFDESLMNTLQTIKPKDKDVSVDYCLSEGDPANEIERVARKENADLIVMGTHGRTGLSRLVMGSVAEQVVRKASCPVTTVKMPTDE